MNDMEKTMDEYERYRQARSGLLEVNKDSVFKALKQAGITAVRVEFDGVGDQGQVESIVALRGDRCIELPQASIEIRRLSWGQTEPGVFESTLPEALESLCYDCLAEKHDGWENGDGAFGALHFDVAAGSVELEFNGRFTDTWTENHTF